MSDPRVALWGRGAAYALAALAAVLGLVCCLDLTPDFTDRLRDDAYYEFAWAANLAAGRGPTVSDGVTTSGVQLLWSLALVPFAWLFGAASLPAIAPWLGALLHLAAAFTIWRSVRDRFAARCAALCWLGNPLLLRECANGQETALACLLLVLLWFARDAGARRFAVLAVLTSLARSDLLPVIALLSLVRHGSRWWRGLPLPTGILALQLAINAALGGGILPDSAAPMAWLWHANHDALEPNTLATLARQWWFTRPVLLGSPWAVTSAFGSALAVYALVRPWWPRALRAAPLLAVVSAAWLGSGDLLVPGVVAVLLALFPGARRRPVPLGLLALFAGLLALVALHWALRWYPRDYYLAPLVVLAIAALLRLRRLRWMFAAFAAAQLVSILGAHSERLGDQEAMALAGRHLHEVVPAGERVGCFNSGLVTFGADVRRRRGEQWRGIVNLDGVVDARAFAALREGALLAWLDEERVRYVVDDLAQFATDPRIPHACGHWFAPDFASDQDLVEAARFVVPGSGSSYSPYHRFRLFQLAGRGAPLASVTRARDLGPWRGGRCLLWPARAGERYEIESDRGRRWTIVTVDRDTVVIAAVRASGARSARLFAGGDEQPMLTFRFD